MSEQKQQPIISIDHVSMRFNLAKEKHESLKEYFVALLQRLRQKYAAESDFRRLQAQRR